VKPLRSDKTALYRNGILILLLLCIVLVVHEIFGENGYLALRQQRRQLETLQEQIQQLKKQNEDLDRQIKALKSDPQAIERVAREQMRMARPGEIIYTLPDKKAQKSQSATPKDAPPNK
jgi:cell division protein FtsB